VGMPKWSDEEESFARDLQKFDNQPVVGLNTKVTPLGEQPQTYASNDSGDISWVVPAGLLSFPASVPGIQYHEWHAAITPTSTIAHKGMVAGAEVMAASVLDLLTEPELVAEAHTEFQKTITASPYFAVLPEDAKPPLELDADTMAKYRPAMSQFYLHLQPRLE
jgi:aminobenzoyl-glutamate utilization protein B